MDKRIEDVENKIPDASSLVATAVLNTKIGEVENKIPDISALVTTVVVNKKIGEAENKIPDVKKLVNERDYDAKITDIEGKYFTTSDYDKFTNDILNAKIKLKELVNKSNISNLVKNSDLNTKLATIATKTELKAG